MSVSIVVNYYNNQRCLEPLIANYSEMAALAPGFFELILVDDHSHEPANPAVFQNVEGLRLFRIVEDVTWNMPGARNIGALESRKRQIFFTDVDHILEADQMNAFISDAAKLELGNRLVSSRKPLEGRDLHPHVNCFLINRQDYFKVGGYEELFSGHYGQEDKYFRFCCRWNGVEDVVSEFRLTAITGGATKGMDRDKSRNEVVIDTLLAAHNVKARRAFQFSYEQII